MDATLSVRSNCSIFCRDPAGSTRTWPPAHQPETARIRKIYKSTDSSYRILLLNSCRRTSPRLLQAGSRADDSAPSEMSVDHAMKLLGVSEGASFDEILRAKKSIIADCKDDQEMIAQVETAYDKLLLQSLSQRRQGKVVNKSVRYADVKPVTNNLPQWLKRTIKNSPVSVEAPSTDNLGIQAGVYATLTVLSYVSGTSSSSYNADVAGLILAAGFGASLYFMTKRNIKLGKAALITTGGVVVGAVVGSAVENLLQVDIVPFLGIHSPATVITEFIIISQFLVSLYLR